MISSFFGETCAAHLFLGKPVLPIFFREACAVHLFWGSLCCPSFQFSVLCIFSFCLSSFYDVLCPILPLTLKFHFWLLLQFSLTFIRDSLERILEFSNVFFDIIQDSNNTLPINCFQQNKRHKTAHYRLKLFVSVSSGEISLLMATVCKNFCHIDENVCHIMFLER